MAPSLTAHTNSMPVQNLIWTGKLVPQEIYVQKNL